MSDSVVSLRGVLLSLVTVECHSRIGTVTAVFDKSAQNQQKKQLRVTE